MARTRSCSSCGARGHRISACRIDARCIGSTERPAASLAFFSRQMSEREVDVARLRARSVNAWREDFILQAAAAVIDDDPPSDHPADEQSVWTEFLDRSHAVEGRRFISGSEIWTVLEISVDYLRSFGLPPGALEPELQQGWLSFECGDVRRRLAPIPERWREMLPGELQELCRRAKPVRGIGHRQ